MDLAFISRDGSEAELEFLFTGGKLGLFELLRIDAHFELECNKHTFINFGLHQLERISGDNEK